jgi:predicted transcriptional regulator of viral defense system
MLRDKIEEAISGKLYISVKELHKIGVSKSSISRLTDNGSLIRVARGVYSLRDDSKDNKYLIHNKYKIGVFSHNSALYFHNLIDHDPDVKVMTVNWNYKLSTDGKFNVKFKYVDKKILRLGMEMRSTSFGHKVPVYNVERTICDVIKSDTKMDRLSTTQ